MYGKKKYANFDHEGEDHTLIDERSEDYDPEPEVSLSAFQIIESLQVTTTALSHWLERVGTSEADRVEHYRRSRQLEATNKQQAVLIEIIEKSQDSIDEQ